MNQLSRNKQIGFSMIEILIALLVLAIGLLGVAALQLSSLSGSQEGYARSQAVAIAEDLSSRIRAGRQQALSSPNWGDGGDTARLALAEYIAQYAAVTPYQCGTLAEPEPPATWCRPDEAEGEVGGECTAVEQVAFEIWEVCSQAQNLLPFGRVHVVTNALNNNRATIAVSWQAAERREDGPQEIDIRNPVCQEVFGNAIPENEDCVLVEIIP